MSPNAEKQRRRRLTSPFIAGSTAAALVLIAEQVDPDIVRECLWRSAALQRIPPKDAEHNWRYTTGNNAIATVAARYDGKLAAAILPKRAALGGAREGTHRFSCQSPACPRNGGERAENRL